METIIERNNVVLAEPPSVTAPGAVSWAAVFAGALAAAALTLVLFILGLGLGLGAISPWSGEGISGSTLALSTILWITLTSLLASGLGGYLTGRLRTRWLNTQADEVYFRDTAHGLLAWSLATLLTAVVFSTATAGVANMGVKSGAAVVGGLSEAASTLVEEGAEQLPGASAFDYYLDSLFRNDGTANAEAATPAQTQRPGVTQAEQRQAADIASTQEGAATLTPDQQAALSTGGGSPETMVVPGQGANGPAGQAGQAAPALDEVARIFTRALRNEELVQEDLTHVSALVANHTGLSRMEAEMRVARIYQSTQEELRELAIEARAVADEVRSTSTKLALWFFVALLAGAFVSSLAATCGGRQRDN